jgi:hypothetical protein
MKIGIETTPELQREVDRLVSFFERLLHPTEAEKARVGAAIRIGFQSNFDDESAGGIPWPRLAEGTARERRRLGFGPYHPILVRSGEYRSSWVWPGDGDHVSEFAYTAQGWAVEEGSQDFRAIFHELGTQHMPARSVVEIGPRGEQRIGTTLDDIFWHLSPP